MNALGRTLSPSILAFLCIGFAADCSVAIAQSTNAMQSLSDQRQRLLEIVSSPTYGPNGVANFDWNAFSGEEISSSVQIWLDDSSITSNRDVRENMFMLAASAKLEFTEAKFQILSRGVRDQDLFISHICMKGLLKASDNYNQAVNDILFQYIESDRVPDDYYYAILENIWSSRFWLKPEVSEQIRLTAVKDLSNVDLVQFSSTALLVSGNLLDFSMLANSVTRVESIVAVLRGIHEARVAIRDTPRASVLSAKPTKDFVISCLDHPEAEVRRWAIWNSISTLGSDSHIDSPEQRAKNKALRDKYLDMLSKETDADIRELLEVYMLPAINEDGTLPNRSDER